MSLYNLFALFMPTNLPKNPRKFKSLYVVLTYPSDRNPSGRKKIGQYFPPKTGDLDLIK
jgi:hypothetical protein